MANKKMELDFDKEIDALLRKARQGPAASVSTGAHLDADEIAAFAENALPQSTKLFYTKHLADCDKCRTILAGTISLYGEAEPEAASSAVRGLAAAIKVPWYRQLLAVLNLAYVMGALVLLFSGFLGYLVFQKTSEPGSTEVSKTFSPESSANKTLAVPSAGSNTAANANTSAPASSANAAANSALPPTKPDTNSQTKAIGPVESPLGSTDADKVGSVGGAVSVNEPKPEAPLQKAQTEAERDEKKLAEKSKEETVTTESQSLARENRKQSDELKVMKESSPPAAKAGPAKPSYGPRRDQNQQWPNSQARANNTLDGFDANRQIGGKNFRRNDGVWYDTVYRGQKTKNFRRGTSDYIKLDGGLRSIADSLEGTVVIVWKDKAYRIQ